jgi:hypothetical protein
MRSPVWIENQGTNPMRSAWLTSTVILILVLGIMAIAATGAIVKYGVFP